MDNNSLCINPVSKVGTGAFIGLCLGTLAKPQRYSLKRILSQTPQYFEDTFNKKVLQKMNEDEIKALNTIKDASLELRKSGSSEDRKIKSAAKKWYKKFISIDVDSSLEQRLKNKKEFLQKAIRESNFIEINKRFIDTNQKLSETPDNTILQEELVSLSKQKKQIKKSLEFPVFEYREAVAAVRKDRMKRMQALPNSGLEVKTLYHKMQDAIAKKFTITSNKLYELTNTPLLKESYGKIKSFLPEFRLSNALKGAAAVGTLTAIGLIFFNPSTRN